MPVGIGDGDIVGLGETIGLWVGDGAWALTPKTKNAATMNPKTMVLRARYPVFNIIPSPPFFALKFNAVWLKLIPELVREA